jgi:enterochelin esterase family protein
MKISLACFSLFLLSTQPSTSQISSSFNAFIQRLDGLVPSARPEIVDSFMAAQKGFPVTEDSIANFVYRGSVTSSIVVTGDHTLWSASGQTLTNVAGTNFYYQSRKFEPDARIDYKFIKDGIWILDPLNGQTVTGGFGPNSEMAMPNFVQPPEIQYNPAIPHGTISSFQFTSINTANTRTIQVYLPPGYALMSRRFPSLYVHDGSDYVSLGSMANVLDNLIDAKKIEPLIVVFVPPSPNRAGEYRQSKITQFSKLMTEELVPYVDSVYHTVAIAAERGTMGSSDGGHISLYLAVNYSGAFGLVGGQSSTITDLFRAPIQNGPKVPIKFYLDVGTYDLSYAGSTFLELNREFRDILLAKEYGVTYAEYHEGHSWGNWRAHIDDILKVLFPLVPVNVRTKNSAPKDIGRFNAYPNPFNPSVHFQFAIPQPEADPSPTDGWRAPEADDLQLVTLKIYDMLGQEVTTLLAKELARGSYSAGWNASQSNSGVYFCRLDVSGRTTTQKIVLLK